MYVVVKEFYDRFIFCDEFVYGSYWFCKGFEKDIDFILYVLCFICILIGFFKCIEFVCIVYE